MSEVPDDLIKVARGVADDHDAKMESLYGPTASTRRAYMIELITVALAAERERATLAERAAWKLAAFVDQQGNVSTTLQSPVAEMLAALEKPPLGQPLLGLYARP